MDEALRARVSRIARWNGGSILVVAGLGAVLSLVGGDLGTAMVGIAIAAAGWHERSVGKALALPVHHSATDLDALRTRLVRAELAVGLLIAGYALWRLATADVGAEISALPEEEQMLLESLTGGDREALEQMFALTLRLTYGTLLIVTLAYQGGMAWWYERRVRSTP